MPYHGAIIGLGNIALKGHLPSYLALAPDVHIVAGVDKAKANLDAFKKLAPAAETYTDYKDIFDDHVLDFIDICTPPAYHCELILEAAKRKINVLCEKPIVISDEQMQQIITAIKQSGISFMPCHQYRYSPQWRMAKKLIAEGKIGKPRKFVVQVLREQANQGNPYYKPDWRTIKDESGGGIVLDHGSHLFYLALHLLGQPRTISAKIESLSLTDNNLEDTARIIIQHEQGVTDMNLTWAAKKRYTYQCIIGDMGDINISEHKLSWQAKGQEHSINLTEGMSKDSVHASWYLDLIKDFIKGMTCPHPETSLLDEAQTVLNCTLLAYESSHLGKPINFF